MSKTLAIILGITAVTLLLIGFRNVFISNTSNKLSFNYLKNRTYPGSEVKIEETLAPESKYNKYIASYLSDGLKIYALLTVPKTQKPLNGYPVIVFNHGYIIPEKYTPDGNYIPHVDALSRAGYIVFKPDYRGHGKSQGSPGSEYFSQNYLIDNLNAIASIKKFKDANPSKIGVWGHSLGGNLTLKDLVVSKDIKAISIWGGVTGSISDILYNWQDKVTYKPDAEDLNLRNKGSKYLLTFYGTPSENPSFWNSIDPTYNLSEENIPVQIQVGLADSQVPPEFSKGLYEKLKSLNKNVEYFEYPGANHDINESFSLAMKRTIDFFNRYLK